MSQQSAMEPFCEAVSTLWILLLVRPELWRILVDISHRCIELIGVLIRVFNDAIFEEENKS